MPESKNADRFSLSLLWWSNGGIIVPDIPSREPGNWGLENAEDPVVQNNNYFSITISIVIEGLWAKTS